MSNHRDDLMYSGDAAECRALGSIASSLGLVITEQRCQLTRTHIVTITVGYGGLLLVRKDFPLYESQWSMNWWVRKQLNDFQSWR